MQHLIERGGWVMIPMLAGSVAAMMLVLERAWYFWRTRLDADKLASEVIRKVDAADVPGALARCARHRHPVAQVLRTGLEHHGQDPRDIERVMEREGHRQLRSSERNLDLLLVIVGVEPLLGFLGTILGLINAFTAWEKYSASVTVSTLAAGISQAMLTTATGLTIAIPYYVLYHVFLSRVNAISHEINHHGDRLAGALAALERRHPSRSQTAP